MRDRESNLNKSLWQLNSGPKLLLAFQFLFRDLFHKFFLLFPYKIVTLSSSSSSYRCYIKRCCSSADALPVLTAISVALQHLFLSSGCDSLPKFSSTSLGKNHCQIFCKKSFSGLFLRAHFVDKFKRTTQSYFPRVHMLPELRGLFLCLCPPTKGRADLPSFS